MLLLLSFNNNSNNKYFNSLPLLLFNDNNNNNSNKNNKIQYVIIPYIMNAIRVKLYSNKYDIDLCFIIYNSLPSV